MYLFSQGSTLSKASCFATELTEFAGLVRTDSCFANIKLSNLVQKASNLLRTVSLKFSFGYLLICSCLPSFSFGSFPCLFYNKTSIFIRIYI